MGRSTFGVLENNGDRKMTRACIVGWAHTSFGKLEDPDVESLMSRVSGEALKHAGIGADQVDGIYVGVSNNGFSKQGFEGALVALGTPGLTQRFAEEALEISWRGLVGVILAVHVTQNNI